MELEDTTQHEVPQQIFQGFLLDLEKDNEVPEETVDRLKKAILDQRLLTEDAIKRTLFPEDTQT